MGGDHSESGGLRERYGERTVLALRDLVGYCDEAARVVAEDGRERVLGDWRTQRVAEAVLNRIGDTINHRLPAALLEEYDGQPWSDIVGQRVRVAHLYHNLDYNIVWNTLARHVPELRTYLVETVLRSA